MNVERHVWQSLRGQVLFFGLALALVVLPGCDTGVEDSPEPGVLRIFLQADPDDRTITIGKTDYVISYEEGTITNGRDTSVLEQGARFNVVVTEGRAFRGTDYGLLFQELDRPPLPNPAYNLFRREDGGPYAYTIFETHLPPAQYDSLQISFYPDDQERVRIMGFSNPIELPRGESPLMTFDVPFEVFEFDTTDVYLRMGPFRSIDRYQDVFHFKRDVQVVDVTYQQ